MHVGLHSSSYHTGDWIIGSRHRLLLLHAPLLVHHRRTHISLHLHILDRLFAQLDNIDI
jgi:hypothetical protein